jgi:hypothetical protein
VKPESPSELKGYLGQRRLVSAGDCQSAVGAGTHKCVGFITSNISWRLAKWKAMVETITSLKTLCAVNGIRMEKTILGVPQQNGVAVCMNGPLDGSRVEPESTMQKGKQFVEVELGEQRSLTNEGDD